MYRKVSKDLQVAGSLLLDVRIDRLPPIDGIEDNCCSVLGEVLAQYLSSKLSRLSAHSPEYGLLFECGHPYSDILPNDSKIELGGMLNVYLFPNSDVSTVDRIFRLGMKKASDSLAMMLGHQSCSQQLLDKQELEVLLDFASRSTLSGVRTASLFSAAA